MAPSTQYIKLLTSGGRNQLEPDGSNFITWKSSLRSALAADETISALTNVDPLLADATAAGYAASLIAHAVWSKESNAVGFSIRLLMAEETKSGSRMEMGAKELIEDLEEEFVGVGPALINKAMLDIMNFKFGTDSLKSLREFESLLTRAKSLPGSGELGDFVKETFVVNHLLHQLGPLYATFRTVFLGTNTKPSEWKMSTFKSALTLEVQSQNAVVDLGVSPGSLLRASATSKCNACQQLGHYLVDCTDPGWLAFVKARDGGPTRGAAATSSPTTSSSPYSGPTCTHCKALNLRWKHQPLLCWVQNPHLRPGHHRPARNDARATTHQSCCEHDHSSNNQSNPPMYRCSYSTNIACRSTTTRRSEDPILLDSAASSHTCGDENAFLDLRPLPQPSSITIANGDRIEIKGIGTLPFRTVVDGKEIVHHLKNTLFVPALDVTLLSVGALLSAGYNLGTRRTAAGEPSLAVYTKDGKLFLETKMVGTIFEIKSKTGKEIWGSN